MGKIDVISIDSGVPMPMKGILPLDMLEVGESILFPLSKRGSVQSRVSVIKRSSEKDFTVKKMDQETARVWRTK